ncbi:unnamed protein product [Prorocentrum cordatum]|uniref:Uncharacterized protein n=1 Tax=Prorocentrum cordatum TaxID=2364126 RepID=A0ABN9VMG8_9DINO|nr:unnamed protein product [Polarella glacialis]
MAGPRTGRPTRPAAGSGGRSRARQRQASQKCGLACCRGASGGLCAGLRCRHLGGGEQPQVAPITPTKLRKEAPPWPEGWQAQKSEGKGQGDDDDGDETSEQAIDDAYRVLAEEGPEVQAPCDPDEEEGRSALPQRAAVVAFALPRSVRAAVALQSGPEEVEEPVGKTEGEVTLSFGLEVPTACVAADVDGISCGLHGDESAVACQAAPCARIQLRQAEIAFEVDFDGRLVTGALVTTAADSQGVPVRVYDLLEDGCVVVPSTRVRSRALPAAWVAAEAARLQRLGASQPFVHRLAAREREALADQHRLRWLLDAWWRMVPRECSSHGTALEEQLTRMNEVVCADGDFDGSFGMGVAQRPFEPQMADNPLEGPAHGFGEASGSAPRHGSWQASWRPQFAGGQCRAAGSGEASSAFLATISYNVGISACEKGGQWQRARAVAAGAGVAQRDAGGEAGARRYLCYIAGMLACKSCGQWQRDLSLLSEMREAKLEPNVIYTYSVGIRACLKGEQWQQALALLSEAKLEPDVISHCALISACDKGGQWHQTSALLCEMQVNWSPTLPTLQRWNHSV